MNTHGKEQRIEDMVRRLTGKDGEPLPDMCVDMMYSIMVNY